MNLISMVYNDYIFDKLDIKYIPSHEVNKRMFCLCLLDQPTPFVNYI